jgi:DNA helicase-2/ATP-dependent DNA helicase PcrA
VVDHNKGRLGKKLRSERGEGKIPVLAFLPDQDTEAEFCAELIGKSVLNKNESSSGNGKKNSGQVSYSSWAIVYRTNAQSLGFETEFLRRHIPYRVVGSLKFYEREEVKDILALLAFLVNPHDEVAFRRMVNKPARGVGPATVDRIIDEAYDGNLLLAAQRLAPGLSAKARAGIATFAKTIEAGKASLASEENPASSEKNDSGFITANPFTKKSESKKSAKKGDGLFAGVGLSSCVVNLSNESGIAEYHLSHDELTGNQRINNLQEVANAASIYDATKAGLLEFLEHIELDRSLDENSGNAADAVTLITMHNTKGLEFRRVIMTGIEQGIFPRDEKKGDDLEEERRLFYVGATRAMDELYMTSCIYRRMYGKTMPMEPSVFLKEVDLQSMRTIGSIPRGFLQKSGAAGNAQNGRFGGNSGHGVASAKGLPLQKSHGSSDGRWILGDRVFNDDYGYGSITQIREAEDGPVIKVVFDTGHETRFLSLHQSSRFTKIKED